MSKNANGEGSVYKRTRDGKVIGYAGALSYPDESGRTKRHTVYGRTRAEVRDKLKAARDRLDAGAPVKDASRTVGEWMRQWRETTLAVSDRKESTRDLYANLSRRHLETGAISTTRLDRLKPSDVEALVLAKRAETKVRDGETVRALSDSTIRQVYTVLRAGLDGAVRDGLLAANPCAKVKRPGVARQEAKHLPSGDVQKVLEAAKASR